MTKNNYGKKMKKGAAPGKGGPMRDGYGKSMPKKKKAAKKKRSNPMKNGY